MVQEHQIKSYIVLNSNNITILVRYFKFLNKTWKSFKNVLTKLIVHIIIAIVVNRQPVQNSICRCGGTC